MTFNHFDRTESRQPGDSHTNESTGLFNQIATELKGAFKPARSGERLTDQHKDSLHVSDPTELYQSEAFHWGTSQTPKDLISTVQDTETEHPKDLISTVQDTETEYPKDLISTVQDTETEHPRLDNARTDPSTEYPDQDYYKAAGSEPNPGIEFPGIDWHKVAGSERDIGIKYPEPSFQKEAGSEPNPGIEFPGQDWLKSSV